MLNPIAIIEGILNALIGEGAYLAGGALATLRDYGVARKEQEVLNQDIKLLCDPADRRAWQARATEVMLGLRQSGEVAQKIWGTYGRFFSGLELYQVSDDLAARWSSEQAMLAELEELAL